MLSFARARAIIAELRTKTLLLVTVVLLFYLLVWQSFTGFYPTYLVDVKGFSPAVAGTVFAVFFGVGVVVKPVSGAAYDRIGMRGSLLAVLVGPVLGLAVLPYIHGFWPIVAVTALVSTMLGSGAITQSYLADTIPADMRGTGLGVIRTTAATLGSSGPVLFGLLADRGFFDEAYLVLAGLMVLVVLLTLRMPSTR
jgi:MFS family permease